MWKPKESEPSTRRGMSPPQTAPGPPRPRLGALLNLQQAAGNAATAGLVRRFGPPVVDPDAGRPARAVQRQSQPAASTATLTPDQRAQLVQAATTLREVPPVDPKTRAEINKAISVSPVYDAIQKRESKRGELARRSGELERWRIEITQPPPEHGTLPTQGMIDEAARDVDRLTKDIEDLDKKVKDGLAEAGVSSEAELAALVTERFPQLFLDRAKQIAQTELKINKRIVEKEINRYGLDMCVDPAAQQSLIAAARDLVRRDKRIEDLGREVDRLRPAANLPYTGPPDPAQVSSSYPDLLKVQAEQQRETSERQATYQAYSLAHPILGHGVNLAEIASGDLGKLDETVGEKLREIVGNIDDTVENVEDGVLKVWSLHNIVKLTAQDLGVSGNRVLMDAVHQRIKQEVTDEAILRVAVAALALTATIVAAVASGGVTLLAQGVAAGATAVAVGASVYQLATSVSEFLGESAASNVALDKKIADISAKEPDLFWVVLDLLSFGLDVASVVAAFTKLAGAIRGAVHLGDVEGLTKTVAGVSELSAAQGERLVAKVGTIAASQKASAEVAGAAGGGKGAIKVTEHLVEGGGEGGEAAALITRFEGIVTAQNARVAAAVNAMDTGYLSSLGLTQNQVIVLANPSWDTFVPTYGNAMELAVARAVAADDVLGGIVIDIHRVPYGSFAPLRPDFVFSGGPMEGFILDLTTPAERAKKLEKYYDKVIVLPYDRPAFATSLMTPAPAAP